MKLNQAEKHISRKDPVLKELIPFLPSPFIESKKDLFYDLVSCVVGQQIHYRRKVPVFEKFKSLLPEGHLTPETVLCVEEDDLKALKLSQAKYQTLVGLAGYWQEQNSHLKNWEKLEDKEIRTLLGAIKGIGPWTVDMILLYTLEKPDIFPYTDYHLKQIMATLYGLDASANLKEQMLEVAQPWSPYRSTAVKYLFSWKDFKKKGKL